MPWAQSRICPPDPRKTEPQNLPLLRGSALTFGDILLPLCSVQRQHRILVVDEDPQVLTLFAKILTEGGYAVTATNQSSEVAQVLRDQFVDLLILDLDMPQPDGFEVLRSLRAKRSTLRILIVSGYLQRIATGGLGVAWRYRLAQ
jgi:PleD family two-component response regulator